MSESSIDASALAWRFITQTDIPVFLSGKAGTGKTTFLKKVVAESGKKLVVAAPTGVAAINAGGMTLHSLFGLPLRPYLPTREATDPNLANNSDMLVQHFKYNRDKLDMLQQLELLIIDEISMVRADLLDAVDLALRYARRKPEPFGGLQLLLIGDLAQLPPVLTEDAKPLLQRHYESEFFFDAHAFRKLTYAPIELDKVYRQKDEQFIQLLNQVRLNRLDPDQEALLHQRFQPDFEPDEPGFITLTSHNRKADEINARELGKLSGEITEVEAILDGEFGEHMLPAERNLLLKPGAQIMFLRNDTSGERLYYNGKIARVVDVDLKKERLLVDFEDGNGTTEIKPETWKNQRYRFNSEKDSVETETLGSFTQFPVRLAWAVTIHKSQGLTFDRVIIDAGSAFAPGQVYVALSRCTSLEGIYLRSRITGKNLFVNERVNRFLEAVPAPGQLQQLLQEGMKRYGFRKLLEVFDFRPIQDALFQWERISAKLPKVKPDVYASLLQSSRNVLREWQEISLRFHDYLRNRNLEEMQSPELVHAHSEKIRSGIAYFGKRLHDELIVPWTAHRKALELRQGFKSYAAACQRFLDQLWNKLNTLYQVELDSVRLYDAGPPFERDTTSAVSVKKQATKGDSNRITLQLFREGHNAAAIADIRGLALSTVEGHFAKLIGAGSMQLEELLDASRSKSIAAALEAADMKTAPALEQLGSDYRLAEIFWVREALLRKS